MSSSGSETQNSQYSSEEEKCCCCCTIGTQMQWMRKCNCRNMTWRAPNAELCKHSVQFDETEIIQVMFSVSTELNIPRRDWMLALAVARSNFWTEPKCGNGSLMMKLLAVVCMWTASSLQYWPKVWLTSFYLHKTRILESRVQMKIWEICNQSQSLYQDKILYLTPLLSVVTFLFYRVDDTLNSVNGLFNCLSPNK